MKANYVIRRGETLSLSLLVIEGDSSVVNTISAVLKKAGPNGTIPSNTAPVEAIFEISPVDLPDIGWRLLIQDEITDTLVPGFYITNAKLNLTDGSVLKTEPILIEVKGSV